MRIIVVYEMYAHIYVWMYRELYLKCYWMGNVKVTGMLHIDNR